MNWFHTAAPDLGTEPKLSVPGSPVSAMSSAGQSMHDRVAPVVDAASLAGWSAPHIHVEDVYPTVDSGRFAVKRVAAEPIDVWADIFRDGHAMLAADLLWRPEGAR